MHKWAAGWTRPVQLADSTPNVGRRLGESCASPREGDSANWRDLGTAQAPPVTGEFWSLRGSETGWTIHWLAKDDRDVSAQYRSY